MARKTIKNKLTSDEQTALINKNNIKLKNDFIMYMRSLKRSEGTISGYDNDLLIFFTYVLNYLDNKDFTKITKRDIIGLQNWLISNGNSSARIRRLKAAISSLSNYCENILSDDEPEYSGYRAIVRKIASPPLEATREKTIWEDSELEDLLDVLVKKNKIQMACFVALGMYSGRRKSELCRFKVSDFGEDRLICNNSLYKSAPILTKGNKYLECYTLANKFKPYLDMWLNYRKENNIESEWLFPDATNSNEHIKVSTLNSWAEVLSKITGRDFYMHSLRHYFVSALSRAGMPDNMVVQIIGWKSADMFAVYNDNSKDDELAKFFSSIK